MLGFQNIASALNLHKGGDSTKKALTAGGSRGERTSDTEDCVVLPAGVSAACRRLRHVSQLAVRGLDFTPEVAPEGFVLEIVVPRTNETLERSDAFVTQNPTWAPVSSPQRGRHLDVFDLRAVCLGHRAGDVLWQAPVTLSELTPLCDDLEELQTLPPCSVPLIRLGNRWHTPASAASSSSSSSPAGKVPDVRRRNHATKQIQASEICSAGDRISVMLDRLKMLQASSAELRQRMENSLLEGQDGLHERRERRHLHEQRVRQLRLEVGQRRLGVENLRAQLGSSNDRGSEQAQRLHLRRGQLSKVEEDQQQAAPEFASQVGGLRSLWQQRRCRQLRMLHEVCQVYPIEKGDGRYWSIRKLPIFGMETLSRQDLREEESVSTALGFLTHLLVTLASILEVPLRINIHQPGCSRSSVSDPHEQAPGGAAGAAPLQWPLYYGRTIEKSRFDKALHLLRDGLHQFLYSRGYFDERRLRGGDLLECANLILQKEMRGTDSG